MVVVVVVVVVVAAAAVCSIFTDASAAEDIQTYILVRAYIERQQMMWLHKFIGEKIMGTKISTNTVIKSNSNFNPLPQMHVYK